MTTTILHRPERIVVGIDGSVASHAAVRWAITHGRSGDSVTPRACLVVIPLADKTDSGIALCQ